MPSFFSALPSDDGEITSNGENTAAWVDSDDERITVSLAANTRLRKLRIDESEDFVNGKEYIKRLRRQYERLHPAPRWADPSALKKRRKLNNDTSDALGTESEAEVSGFSEELAAQPLAKLLQSAEGLTTLSKPADSHRKLRPEIIDVHRLKDIGKAQPVCAPQSLNSP